MFFQKKQCSAEYGAGAEPVWNLTEKNTKKKIAVTGISRRAGTTFVSVSLAFLLASVEREKQYKEREPQERLVLPAAVSLLEMRRPEQGDSMMYYAAALDRRFQGRRFTDFFSLYMQGETLPKALNLHKGIHWAVWRKPAGRERNELMENLRVPAAFPLEQMPGTWLIADSPTVDTLQKYDLVIALIDPLPSSVYAGAETYERIRDMQNSGLPVLWVLNKDHPDLNHSALKRFLKLQQYEAIPLLNPELFCKAEYAGKLTVEVLDEREREPFERLKEKVLSILKDT